MRSAILSSTSAVDRSGRSKPRLCHFTPQVWPCTHCTGAWMGHRSCVDACGKCGPYRVSTPIPCRFSKSLYRL